MGRSFDPLKMSNEGCITKYKYLCHHLKYHYYLKRITGYFILISLVLPVNKKGCSIIINRRHFDS